MSETNNSLRIRTQVDGDSFVSVQLDQTYDTFEILSLKMKSEDVYKLHSSSYGVIAGRVLANENFGVPNAKISIFIQGDFEEDGPEIAAIYPYKTTASENGDGIKYNLLPDSKIDDCHQVVGTFPNKTYLLDNDVLIEVFDKYYKYTTRTNNSGDYIIAGVPTGSQTLHMDLDLSDCGILSQRPRDFVYKGYTIEQFENPNQFKTGSDLASLSQIFSQDQVVNVLPFWGNEDNGETIGITRADIKISFKFEPTCVFMGSLVGDNSSNGISKKCVPTNQMGAMDELTTGEGTIEMIRKTPSGRIEEFQVRGTQLIDGNGIWCYQIPMNLDYMMTDEYGNMVPTDDPSKGIPTRTRVRFRISMQDMEKNTDNYFRAKVLVPHNPQTFIADRNDKITHEDYDYEFGSDTKEESFRDLMWNNVYTVKSYIPRFQKSRQMKSERFTGIKHCNIYGNNNPMPYNNIRIRMPLMFTILCAIIKAYIRIVYIVNNIINFVCKTLVSLVGTKKGSWDWLKPSKWVSDKNIKPLENLRYLTLADGLCPDLENWYFAPTKKPYSWTNGKRKSSKNYVNINILKTTFEYLKKGGEDNSPDLRDKQSTEYINADESQEESLCLTINTDYLIACVEMALAQEYKVINFDFYNDWVNGVIYMPRWMRFIRPKRRFLFGLIRIKPKIKACMDNTSVFNKNRFYVQQCALSYEKQNGLYTKISNNNGCAKGKKQKCHKKQGRIRYSIFGGRVNKYTPGNGGIVHENETMKHQYVYYLKPCEWRNSTGRKTILFANDIVLLGSLLECNMYGVPQAFKYLTSSSYIMPTNLALTNMDDDGINYTDDSGTMCSTDKDTNNINLRKMEDIVRGIDSESKTLLPVDNSFSGTAKYYSTSDEPIVYGKIEEDTSAGNIFDDTIPITEAAGIAWNYTGPGQGTKSNDVSKSLYMPGGHFLGISCKNTETNIKSCVNLQRICEVGANMSQRREEIREVQNSNNEYQLKYRYFTPTGLIANDEINNSDFRTMFATMNHKRLLCTDNFDEKTGYPIYDFIYMRNSGFNGALGKQVYSDNSPFNQWTRNIAVRDEYPDLTSRNAGIETASIARDYEYDLEEPQNTVTRTIERTSIDYYKFRLGLDTVSDKEQKLHYLINNPKTVALPQYENSFYFYFGLHDGATAFDEFNKQFFSVCESESILKRKISLNISEITSSCSFISDVRISGRDASGEVVIKIEYYNDNGEKQTATIPSTDISLVNGVYSATVTLNFGTYTFIVTDDNGIEVSKQVKVGSDSISVDVETKSFNFRTTDISTPAGVSTMAKQTNSGYIKFSNMGIDNIDIAANNIMLTIVEKNENDENVRYWSNKGQGAGDVGTQTPYVGNIQTDIINNELYIYLWASEAKYDVYFWNSCGDGQKYVYYGTYLVDGIDSIELYMGSYQLPYSSKLNALSGNWWTSIGSDRTSNGSDNWAMRDGVLRRINNDTEYFTNKIFSRKKPIGKDIDTALFGQPELEVLSGGTPITYNNEQVYFSGVVLPVNAVFYEDDVRFGNGVISDSAIIPTTPSSNRALWGEMAYENENIVSDSVGIGTVTNIVTNADGSYTITLTGVTINTNKIITGHGCLGKLENNIILNLIYEGNNRFTYEGDEIEVGETISLHPIFYFPVIYKPFYSDVYIVDWVNESINLSEDQYSSGDMEYGYLDERYKMRGYIHNGLTWEQTNGRHYLGDCYFTTSTMFDINEEKEIPLDEDSVGKFGTWTESDNLKVVIGNTRYTGTTVYRTSNDITPLNGNTDAIIEADNLNQEDSHPIDEYTYSFTEHECDNFEQYNNNPYEIEIYTIQDDLSPSFAQTISYRKISGSTGTVYKFTNDIGDTDNTYYLIKKSAVSNPLVFGEYVSVRDLEANMTRYILARFGPNSDRLLGVSNTTDTPLNKEGENVILTVSTILRRLDFAYRPSSDSTELVTKSTYFASSDENIAAYVLREYDITVANTYTWGSTATPDAYYNNVFNYLSSNNRLETNRIRFNATMSLPDAGASIDDYYAVIIAKQPVDEKGFTHILRIYSKFIQLKTSYDDNASSPFIKINNATGSTSITYESSGGDKLISIQSNVPWTFTLNSDASNWVKIIEDGVQKTSISGTNNMEIILRAVSGATYVTGTAVARITNGTGSVQLSITREGSAVTGSLDAGTPITWDSDTIYYSVTCNADCVVELMPGSIVNNHTASGSTQYGTFNVNYNQTSQDVVYTLILRDTNANVLDRKTIIQTGQI